MKQTDTSKPIPQTFMMNQHSSVRIHNQNKQPIPPESDLRLESGLLKLKNRRIRGLVVRVVDGNTFELRICGVQASNEKAKPTENIRIHKVDKPSVSTLSGILAKLELERKLIGRSIECEVLMRDDHDQLIAYVPEKYLNSPFPLILNRK